MNNQEKDFIIAYWRGSEKGTLNIKSIDNKTNIMSKSDLALRKKLNTENIDGFNFRII